MLIVDALRLKLEENVLQGKPSPLNLARGKYGTDPDISRLLEEAKGVSEIAASDGYYF
jgi:hypothetical protein